MALNGPKTVNCSTSTTIRYLGACVLHANLHTRMRNCARKRARACTSKGQNDPEKVHPYPSTPAHRYTNTPLHRYTLTPVTSTPVPWYTGAGTPIRKYTDTPVHKSTDYTQVHKYTGTPVTNIPARRYTGTQVHGYTSTWVHRYPGTPVHK